MHAPRLILAALLCGTIAVPAFAEDQLIQPEPCTFLCHVWRNLSGKVQGTASYPIDAAVADTGEPLAATEGAGPPRLDHLVKQRGLVAVETPAERAARLRQRAALERELTATAVLPAWTKADTTAPR